jgi:hypothetical protein
MAFPIIPKKRSGATGNPASLQVGELAVNTLTGELFLGGDSAVMLLNPPTLAGTTVTEHTGDGTTTAFTFTGYNGTADGGYLVSVGGIDQPPSKYAVTSTAGGTITFVEAPIVGELISIRAIVAGGGGGGGGITELTGDVTASGTGSVAATLASVTTAQANVGSATAIPVLSVDEKGRVTELTTVQFGGLTTTQIAGLSTTAPAALATSAVVGLSTFTARADHQHVFPSAADVGALGATAAAGGDLTGTFPNPTLTAITTAQTGVGSSTVVPVLSVDDKGRVTSLTTAQISGGSSGGITALTGDVTASGTGSVEATLASVTTAQSNVGSGTQIPVISIDEKGRVTSLTSVGLTYVAEVLLVAGGGAGGGGAGGGGGGGLLVGTLNLTPGQSYSILVGAGGSGQTLGGGGSTPPANDGSNSSAFNLVAIGGGGGGAYSTTADNQNGHAGGSGGGGGLNEVGASNAGGAGTAGQGFAGGNANQLSSTGYCAAGGGGAGAVGGDKLNLNAGAGGAGKLNSITGAALYWAGGGGGGASGGNGGNGGIGGGGGGAGGDTAGTGGGSALNPGANGTTSNVGGNGGANTGGGGGGMSVSAVTSGSGGSGVCIIAYAGGQKGTGGTVTFANGNTIHTFTSSGTYVA